MSDDHSKARRRFLQMGLGLVGAAALGQGAQAATPLAGLARSELERAGAAVKQRDLVGVVDFSKPSRAPRLHLVDLANGKVDSFLVAHGRGSDPAHSGWVKSFSNAFGSNASSSGAYVTGDYYVGKHGRSLNLHGLEPTNSNALARRIVVHSADYVSPGRAVLGRSEGCFAVAHGDLDQVLRRLGEGRLLVARKYAA